MSTSYILWEPKREKSQGDVAEVLKNDGNLNPPSFKITFQCTVLFRPNVHVMRHKPFWTEHLGTCHRSQMAVNTGFNFKKKSPPEDPLKLSEHLP